MPIKSIQLGFKVSFVSLGLGPLWFNPFLFLICALECHEGLGMENGEITDAQISASSEWNSLLAATLARLHIKGTSERGGGWTPLTLDLDKWLQVDLGNQKINVTGVATQGRNDIDFWVKTYNLQFSNNGENFTYYIEQSGQGVDSSPRVKFYEINIVLIIHFSYKMLGCVNVRVNSYYPLLIC